MIKDQMKTSVEQLCRGEDLSTLNTQFSLKELQGPDMEESEREKLNQSFSSVVDLENRLQDEIKALLKRLPFLKQKTLKKISQKDSDEILSDNLGAMSTKKRLLGSSKNPRPFSVNVQKINKIEKPSQNQSKTKTEEEVKQLIQELKVEIRSQDLLEENFVLKKWLDLFENIILVKDTKFNVIEVHVQRIQQIEFYRPIKNQQNKIFCFWMFQESGQKINMGDFLNASPADHDYDNDIDTEEDEMKMAQSRVLQVLQQSVQIFEEQQKGF